MYLSDEELMRRCIAIKKMRQAAGSLPADAPKTSREVGRMDAMEAIESETARKMEGYDLAIPDDAKGYMFKHKIQQDEVEYWSGWNEVIRRYWLDPID